MTTPAKTVTLTGHVYELRFSWETESTFCMMSSDNMADRHYTYVGPVSIEYAIPESYNPTAAKLAALAAKRDQVCREFAASVRAIDEQISKLTAISYDEVPA